jgi:hypothetical protein
MAHFKLKMAIACDRFKNKNPVIMANDYYGETGQSHVRESHSSVEAKTDILINANSYSSTGKAENNGLPECSSETSKKRNPCHRTKTLASRD